MARESKYKTRELNKILLAFKYRIAPIVYTKGHELFSTDISILKLVPSYFK